MIAFKSVTKCLPLQRRCWVAILNTRVKQYEGHLMLLTSKYNNTKVRCHLTDYETK